MALLGICRGLEAQQTEGRQTGDEQAWTVVGPAGGDARAFAAVPGDPSHLYLGSTNSWLYESVNGGASWRLQRAGRKLGRGSIALNCASR